MSPTPSRPRAWARALVLPLAVALSCSVASIAPATGSEPSVTGERSTARTATATQSIPATSFRASTFNVLGADHTAPGGKRKGWDPGIVRMERVVQLLVNNDIDVVGFQEFQPPQAVRFQELVGSGWSVYPGVDTSTGAPSVNSIAWRTDTWTLVEANTLPVPYFSGAPSRMPYVLLQNLETGRQAWFFNTHNPANVRGNAQVWRDQGFAMEVALANQLRASHPDAAFLSFGDKNESSRYYCAVAPAANMWSASGGYVDGATCSPPKGRTIDWIMGTKDVFFNGYTRLNNSFVKKTSDHPLYFANAVIPASDPTPADHVVVVAVPGMTSSAIRSLGNDAGELKRMSESGASTMNARTVTERTTADSNLFSLLSGRRVTPRKGGHGIGYRRKDPATVHSAAGQYVSSVLDLVHNSSLSTTVVGSRPALRTVRESWNRRNGGKDPYGVDDGTAKINRFRVYRDDSTALAWWKKVTARNPSSLSVVELSGALQAGEKNNFRGKGYKAGVRKVSHRVAQIRRTINAQPELRGRTMLVVVGTHGALKMRGSSRTWAQSYRVPMYVTGPGVAQGADLYRLNPSYANPRRQQPGYGGAQPIRTGDVANLVTRVLGLPPVPGSTMNATQTLQVVDPASLLVPARR